MPDPLESHSTIQVRLLQGYDTVADRIISGMTSS